MTAVGATRCSVPKGGDLLEWREYRLYLERVRNKPGYEVKKPKVAKGAPGFLRAADSAEQPSLSCAGLAHSRGADRRADHRWPSQCKIVPALPTAQTFAVPVPQTSFKVSLVPLGTAVHAAPSP